MGTRGKIICFLALAVTQSMGCTASVDEEQAGGDLELPDNAVGPEGATLEFPGGIQVEVPQGAYAETTYVSALPLQAESLQALLDGSGNVKRTAIAGVSLEPSGPLATPVTVTIPLQGELPDHGLPIHYRYDPEYDAYYPSPTDVIISREEGTATLVLTEFSDHVLAFIANILQSDCAEEEPCRCGRFHVEETSVDKIYEQDDCQASNTHGFIRYLECGPDGVTESWTFLEHTRGCVPKLSLAPQRPLLAPGDTTLVEAKLTYLEDPFPDVTVQMSVGDIVSLDPTSVITDENGSAQSTALAGTREGVALVRGEAYILYPSKIIAADGVEQDVVERGKWIQAKTEVTVDIPTKLQIDIQAGFEGDHLTYNETTEIEVAVLDFSDSQDPTAFSYVPGVVVDLEASAGSLASPQVMTSSQGPVTVEYTAPNLSQTITVKATAQHDTLTENISIPIVYDVTGEDSIQVQAQADWLGSMDLSWTGCGAPGNPSYPGTEQDPFGAGCIGYRYYLSAHFEFVMDVDDAPNAPEMNVSGTGSVRIKNAHTIDGPILIRAPHSDCPSLATRQFAHDVETQSFDVSITGFLQRDFNGKDDLWALFQDPVGGLGATLMQIGQRGVNYCNGVPYNTQVTPDWTRVIWNPAINFFWHPDFYPDDEGFRIDLLGRTSVTQSGKCGSGYNGGECSYYLTMTRVSPE